MYRKISRILSLFRSLHNVAGYRLGLLLLLMAYLLFGALVFSYLEYLPKEHKEDGNILNIHNPRFTRKDLMKELLLTKDEMNIKIFKKKAYHAIKKYSYSIENKFKIQNMGDDIRFTYMESLFYCITIITTIGYGNIAAKTYKGQLATLIYSLVGIPLCLIIMAEYGKLLTKYTKKIIAISLKLLKKGNIVIDESFDFTPAIALTITAIYLIIGAITFSFMEEWTYFQAFYFLFISMSTIGFGDIVPKHTYCYTASLVYLLCGMALISMTITSIIQAMEDNIHVLGKYILQDDKPETQNDCKKNN